MSGLVVTTPGQHPTRPVHIVFVGAGAVGCYYASRLHHPTHNIHTSLVARSNFQALAKHGVKLETRSFGDYTFQPHAVFPSIAAAAANPHTWDFVVVTTKALPDHSDDSALIAPLVSPQSCIVLIQNGVGVEEPYRSRFADIAIVSAVTVVSAEQIRPGTIRQNRWTRIHLGPYTDSASFSSCSSSSPSSSTSSPTSRASLEQRGADAASRLADWWSRLGGLRDATVVDEVELQTVRWHKLCINAAMNPSAVLSGGRENAAMAHDPELRAHLRGVMAEIWAAAPRLLGRPFPEGLADPDQILLSSERNTMGRPSMLLDWEAGRPLELEVILGNPVRMARAKGVELPRTQSLYALLRSAQMMRDKARAGKGKL